jgi:hypothetical protein
MSKVLILAIMLLALGSASLTRNHEFWYTAGKAAATAGLWNSDYAWNYCDMKCTYLEKLFPGNDYVVISFSESTFKPNFASCYIAKTANNTTTYALWNTGGKNTWYETNCGADTEDYYALTKGDKPKYTIVGNIEGAGIGT